MVEVAAGPNPDPQNRRGAVVLNTQRAEIIQAAGQCIFTLAESSESFGQAGGSGRVDVRASSPLCTWTAESDSEWIALRSNTGQGSSSVTFDVAPTAGPPRSGQLTVAGQRFSVTQSQGCTYSIAPTSHSAPGAGGSGTIAVTTIPACPWTAASNADWISIASGSSGTGSGAVTFSVAPGIHVPRTGTLVVAGQVFSVTQPPNVSNPPPTPPPPPPASCAYVVVPASHSFGAGGGSGTVTVTAGNGCAWTASTVVPWISIPGSTSGTADGTVTFTVAATTGPSRSGTLTVAGQTVTVTQSQGCSFAIAPETESLPASGGSGTVAVTAPDGCAWTAASNAPWLTISSGESGSGNGTVRFVAASTTGPSRSGTLTIAGRTFTVNQGQGCTFRRDPSSATVPASGSAIEFELLTEAGCAWTASADASWISLSPGSTAGTGPARVKFTVEPNTGPLRTAIVTAGGRAFTVTQESGCRYSLSAEEQDIAGSGGSGSVDVTTAEGCTWEARSQADWITINSGASGTGNGSVAFTASPNPGAERSGTMTIAGRTFTIEQAQSCSFSIAPERQSIDPAGGNTAVAVTAPGGCGWTASTPESWINITSGASGSGNGSVAMSVAANGGAPRSGTVTIAGRTFTIDQGQSCSFSIAPEQQNLGATGGNTTVAVTAPDGCGWTASTPEPWISITSGASGSGNGSVSMTVAANDGPPRSGTVTIAGRAFTINQGQSCSFSIAPEQQSLGAAGGNTAVAVTAGDGCAWTASTLETWISITSGASGSGNGSVAMTVAANDGAPRSGTVTIAGRAFTINQGQSCSFDIDPDQQTVDAAGGSTTVAVNAAAGCGWTAASEALWMAITSPASGSGSGSVQVAIERNTGAPRSGTVRIAGLPFTVNQGSGCSFELEPTAVSSPSAGGRDRIRVRTDSDCSWTASETAPWIAITSGSSGSGNGEVELEIAVNPGPARDGVVTVAGRDVIVSQASGCTFTLSASSHPALRDGGAGSVTVTAGAGCTWTAVSQANWIAVTAGSAGNGDGRVDFAVEANATGAPRSGTILIAGQTFTVNQE